MIENPEIARVFDEIADCLELQGENPFRVRAYRNAARVVRDLQQPAAALAGDPKRLQELQGIGKDLASKICALANTGRLPLGKQATTLPAKPSVSPLMAPLLRRRPG